MGILIISVIAGMLLGLRFKLFALVPAVLLATTVIVGTGVAIGHALAPIALMALAAVAALEIGYVAGVILRGTALAHLTSHYRQRHREPKMLNR